MGPTGPGGLGVTAISLLASTPILAALALDSGPEYEAAWRTVLAAGQQGRDAQVEAVAQRCLGTALAKQSQWVEGWLWGRWAWRGGRGRWKGA